MTTKKAVDIASASAKDKKDYEMMTKEQKVNQIGIAGDPPIETAPEYLANDNEKVVGLPSAQVVFGRDRPTSRISGYGGRGDTDCGSVDIVAGRLSSEDLPKDEKVFANNSPSSDAARVLVVQKTDVDRNFGLAAGASGESKARSAAISKADAARVVGRESVKIITEGSVKNSQGGVSATINGVELIAGNNTNEDGSNPDFELQPFVKGDNLKEMLGEMIDMLSEMDGIVDSLVNIQSRYNEVLANHFHISPFFGIPDTPSPMVAQQGVTTSVNMMKDVTMSLMSYKNNLARLRTKYLEYIGDKSIRSKWNKVN